MRVERLDGRAERDDNCGRRCAAHCQTRRWRRCERRSSPPTCPDSRCRRTAGRAWPARRPALGRQPCGVRDVLAEHCPDVRHDGLHSRLLLSREVARRIQLPDGIGHRRLRDRQRTRVSRAPIRGMSAAPRRRRAAARRRTRRSRGSADSPSMTRAAERRRAPRRPSRPRAATRRPLAACPAGGLEERGPVQARRLAREVRSRPSIVGVAVDGRGLTGGLRLGDGGFEREHRLGALVRVIESRERQHAGDVLLVATALLEARGSWLRYWFGPRARGRLARGRRRSSLRRGCCAPRRVRAPTMRRRCRR